MKNSYLKKKGRSFGSYPFSLTPQEAYTRSNGIIVQVYNRLHAALTKTRLTNDTIVYHGTSRIFDKFEISERKSTTPVDEVNAFFFTSDLLNAYNHARRSAKEVGGKSRVIAAKIDFNKLEDVTSKVKRYQKELGNFGKAKRKAYAEVDATKVDGIEFRGDSVNPPEYVVFNPNIIKIVDPQFKEKKLEAAVSRKTTVLKNPSPRRVSQLIKNEPLHEIKGFIHGDDLYIWNNVEEHHHYNQMRDLGYDDKIIGTNRNDYNKIVIMPIHKGGYNKDSSQYAIVNYGWNSDINRSVSYLFDNTYIRKLVKELDLFIDNTEGERIGNDDHDSDNYVSGREYMKRHNITASSTSYGYWIQPDGTIAEVDYEDHLSYLRKNFHPKENLYSTDLFYKQAFAQGWIRVVNSKLDTGFELMHNCVTPAGYRAASTLLAGMHAPGYYLDVRRENEKVLPKGIERYVIFDEGQEKKLLLELRKHVKKEITATDDPYGYWFTDAGKLEPVPYLGHFQVVEKYLNNNPKVKEEFKEWKTETGYYDETTFALYELGWIRVVAGFSLNVEIAETNVNRKAFEAFKKSLNDISFVNVVLDVSGNESGTVHYQYTRKQLLKLFNKIKENLNNEITSSEEPYGYWFTSDGKKLEVPYQSHNSVAEKYIVKNLYKEYFDYVMKVDQADYVKFCLNLGWIRTAVEGNILDVNILDNSVSPVAARSLNQYIRDNYYEHISLDITQINPSANDKYMSFDITNPAKMREFSTVLRKNTNSSITSMDLEASTSEPYFTSKALREINEEADNPKSRTTLIMMKPSDFLKMAEPGFDKQKYEKAKQLNKDRIQYNSVPYLVFETNDDGTAIVTGHEGRHRALVIKELGDKPMPVAFKSSGGSGGSIRWGSQNNKYDKIDVWPTTLIGEAKNSVNRIPFPDSEYYPRNKNIESSINYNYWITNTGDLITVYNTHYDTAKNYINSKYKENYIKWIQNSKNIDVGYDNYAFFVLKWIRVVYYSDSINFQFAKNILNHNSVNTIKDLIQNSEASTIHIDVETQSFKFEVDQMSKIRVLLNKNINKSLTALDESENTFECWITDKEIVPSTHSHLRTLKAILDKYKDLYKGDLFKQFVPSGDFSSNEAAYNYGMRQLGFIRIVGSPAGPSLMIAENSVHPNAARLLDKYFRERLDPKTIVFVDWVSYPEQDTNYGSKATFIQNLNAAKTLQFVRKNIRRDIQLEVEEKTIVAIDEENNVQWVANEALLETWTTGNGDQRLELVKSNGNYLVRCFNPDGSLDQEDIYHFQETASAGLFKIVEERQKKNLFYSKEADMNITAADDETVFERWETSDGKYASVVGQEGKVYVIKDYVKNQLTGNWHSVGRDSLGNVDKEKAIKEFYKKIDRLNATGMNYQLMVTPKNFTTPKDQKKLEVANVKVRGKAGSEKEIDGFKLFSKQPDIKGLKVYIQKSGSYQYAKIIHEPSDLVMLSMTNSALPFTPTELVDRINNSDLNQFNWNLSQQDLFNKYGEDILMRAVRQFQSSLSETMKDATDKELDSGLKEWVRNYLIARYMARPKEAKEIKRKIDIRINEKGLNGDKVYNYYGNPDDLRQRETITKNIGLVRVGTSAPYKYQLASRIKEPIKEEATNKPPVVDKLNERILKQKTLREAAQKEEIIRKPPSETTIADSMIGDYVEGIAASGNKVKGVVLKQTYNKKKVNSSGTIVTELDDDNRLLEVTNMKRLFIKPSKKLTSIYNIYAAKRRLEAART